DDLVTGVQTCALPIFGTFFISGHFFHSTKAAGQFAPMDVGDLPPLIRVSQLLGSDHANRTLQMSVGLKVHNQDQLNTLLHDLYRSEERRVGKERSCQE